MKKVLLVLFLLSFISKVFAQQFSQYNTGSLYDAFENPSQHAFLPDSSKKYASNFFIPNFNVNLFLSGDGQATLKSRLFLNKYDNSALLINKGRYNHVNENVNAYILMLRMFASLSGDEELGFSWQLKSEGNGSLSDESLAALSGAQSFNTGQNYSNVFNSRYVFQTYHQFSLTYREKFNKQVDFGVKLSLLLGVQYQKLNVTSSNVVYVNHDTASIALQGRYISGFVPGHFISRDYLPALRSPGAAITIGSTYRTEDNFIIQGNIKDLGFISWSKLSNTYNFSNNVTVAGLSTPQREDSLYNKVYNIIHHNGSAGSFTTPIDGRAELSISKHFWIDDRHLFSYSPTAVASKELFYPGFIGALVNPFQYKRYGVTLTTTYDDLKIFSLGAQFMVKTPNWEVYIGSDKIAQTVSFAGDAISKSSPNISQNSAYTGMSVFLGFSLKLGPLIEHQMNASSIPAGEKGFLGRLWGRFFKTYN